MEPNEPTELHPAAHGTAAHGTDGMVGPHGAMADHGASHGHDDHAHGDDAIGPVDLRLWGAAGLGILLGLVVAVALAIGASFQLTFGG